MSGERILNAFTDMRDMAAVSSDYHDQIQRERGSRSVTLCAIEAPYLSDLKMVGVNKYSTRQSRIVAKSLLSFFGERYEVMRSHPLATYDKPT